MKYPSRYLALTFFILGCVLGGTSNAQFAQQGDKLVGTGAVGNSQQGISVALSADGNTAIAGGRGDNGNAGAAWVFTRSGGVWSQQGSKLVGTGAVGSAQQGMSVALSSDGNTAIVGGHNDNSDLGAAWVFTRSGGVWTQQGNKLVGTGAVGGSYQGQSVALSSDGNTAIVGGLFDNGNAGAAWVFTRSGGVWTQQGNKLVGTGAVGSAQQGISVALSSDGNTALLGGPSDNSDVGAAWVFTRSGGVWTQQGNKLVVTGAVGSPYQGYAVSLSGDGNAAIVGGFNDNGGLGAAWVFTRSSGLWSQQAKLVGTGAVGSAWQGHSVSLSSDGNTAFVGGALDNSSVGATWVFTRSGGVWSQQGSKLIGTGAVGNASQGVDVSVSSDGTTAIVGGQTDNTSLGAMWVYVQPDTPTVISTNPAANALNVSRSVDISIVFGGDIDAATLTNGTIRINGRQSGLHDAIMTYNSSTHTVTIDPVADFRIGEVVTVALTTAIRNTIGGPMASPRVWSFTIATLDGSGLFAQSLYTSSVGNPWDVAVGDVDGDGDLDVIAGSQYPNTVSILKNNDAGTFTEASTPDIAGEPASLAVGDLDSDGDLDLIAVKHGSNAVSILKNDGTGAFALTSTPAVNSEPWWVEAGDFDGDGDLDLAVTSKGSSTVSVLKNNGDGTFAPAQGVSVSRRTWKLAIGDFDGDGDLDLATTSFLQDQNASVSILKNDGTGYFTETSTISLDSYASSIEAGDLDGDGDVDLAVGTDFAVSTLRNDGTGLFTNASSWSSGINRPYAGAMGDLNGDGTLDVVVVNNYSNTLSVLGNDGTGTLTQTSMPSVESNPMSVVSGDLDSDGDLDLAVASPASGGLLVLANESSTDPDAGLVAYYPFNGNANDSSGIGRHATVFGATAATDRFGNPNSAYSFDGQNDYIAASGVGLPSATRTTSIWFKANSIVEMPTLLEYGTICGRLWLQGINHNSGQAFTVVSGCHVKDFYDPYDSPPLGSWTHWVVVTKSTGTTFYVNGVEIGSSPLFFDDTNVSEGVLSFGVASDNNGNVPYTNWSSGWYNGLLDDIRVYNRALTSAEIDSLYHEGGWPFPPQGLVAYYPFNGNAYDGSGNNNNGTVYGASLTIDRFGVADNAYHFNQLGDVIEVPISASLQLPNPRTVVAWIRLNSDVVTESKTIIASGVANTSTDWALIVNTSGSPGVMHNRPHMWIDGQWRYYNGTTELYTQRWHMVAMTFDGSLLKSYVDGFNDGSMNYPGTVRATSSIMRIGSYTGPSSWFPGDIDDIRIYNRVLTEAEIADLYHEGGWPHPSSAIVVNGGFESGTSPWEHYHNGGATNAFNVVTTPPVPEGTSKARIVLDATIGTNNQIWQDWITLEENTDYQIRFKHHASASTSFRVRLIEQDDDYSVYGFGWKDVYPTTSVQTYTLDFTTANFTGTVMDAMLQFYFVGGTPSRTIYLDNVVITKQGVTPPALPPWNYVNTGVSHTIIIPLDANPSISGVSLSDSDYVGVFYDSSGTPACAGYERWAGSANIGVAAFGDDPTTAQKDGLAAGEIFKWKVYRGSDGLVFDANASYQPAGGIVTHTNSYATNGISQLKSLTALHVTHALNLRLGWGLISSYVIPQTNSLDSLFKPVIGDLVILKNGQGKTYIPSVPVNTIGSWVVTEGYQVKMSTSRSLGISGLVMTPGSQPISLPVGWSIMPYLKDTESLISTVLASVVADVIMVKDQDGRTYIPSLGINAIGTMRSGQAYQIKMLHARTIDFMATAARGGVLSQQSAAKSGQKAPAAPPWSYVNTGISHTIIVPLAASPNVDGTPLTDGDCIGVFYDSSGTMACGGYEAWTGSGNIAIPAFGDDATTTEKDGLDSGELFTWKVWRQGDGSIVAAQATYVPVGGLGGIVTDTSAYNTNGISALSSLTGTVVGISQTGLPKEFSLEQNYPNPFNPSTTIRYAVPVRSHVTLTIFNTIGQQVSTLVQREQEAGYHEVQFEASGLASGVYLYRMQAGDFVQTRKLVLLQ